MTRWPIGIAAIAAIAAATLVATVASGLRTPAAARGEPRVFEVARGDTLSSVAARLDDLGLLPRSALFGPRTLVLYARLRGVDRQIKTGEYDLDPTMTPLAILDKLLSGAVKTHPVTLPEGLRLDEIAQRLEETGILRAGDLLDRAHDAELARSLGIAAPSFEGYLYPETYRFRRGSAPEEVIRRMYEEFESRWTEDDHRVLAESGMTLHQVVTLASIVEKETSVPEERPLIAAVFRNRLARGMRLQTDPTVIYGILRARGSFDGNIRKRDLQEDTPYNTYTRAGLPPGPIASTGISSIRAVLGPAPVPYLYFVSRNDGTHEFSATLREHTTAVDRYQRRARHRGNPS